jgi:hypothetical protein
MPINYWTHSYLVGWSGCPKTIPMYIPIFIFICVWLKFLCVLTLGLLLFPSNRSSPTKAVRALRPDHLACDNIPEEEREGANMRENMAAVK